MTLTCICGAVTIQAPRPDFIHACNCTLCAKTGARWGYFAPAGLRVSGTTRGFRRRDKPQAGSELHFCPACGATTHFVLTPEIIAKHGNSMMGANLALADPADLAGIELRFPDGRSWPGEGPFGYYRDSEIIGG